MTRTDYQVNMSKCRRIRRLLETSETLILSVMFVWGVQLFILWIMHYRPPVHGFKPYMFSNIALPLGGLLPISLSVLHVVGIALDNPGWRRRVIGAESLVFLYSWWSLINAASFGIDMIATGAFVIFSAVNFYTLMRPLPLA